jgi:hydrogenase-4 component F
MLAGIFGAALLALLGFPPFSLFASEIALVRAGFAAHLGLVVGAALLLLLVAFAALAGHGGRMLLGAAPPDPAEPAVAEPAVRARVPLITALILLAGLGLSIWPIQTLLTAAAQAGR